MRISTKKGDYGETSVFSGARVKKSDPVIKVLGELDELNSFLGFVKARLKDVYVFDFLQKIQKDIYRMMSMIGNEMKPVKGLDFINEQDIEYLEKNIEKLEGSTGSIGKFVIPGENELSARTHLARVACRRAERSMVEHADFLNIDKKILIYLNRLSDLLFLAARSFE